MDLREELKEIEIGLFLHNIEEYKKKIAEILEDVKILEEQNNSEESKLNSQKEQKEALEQREDEDDVTDDDGEYKLSDAEMQDVKKYYNESVSAYSKYLELSPTATDASDVNAKIDEINGKLEVLDSDTGVATN